MIDSYLLAATGNRYSLRWLHTRKADATRDASWLCRKNHQQLNRLFQQWCQRPISSNTHKNAVFQRVETFVPRMALFVRYVGNGVTRAWLLNKGSIADDYIILSLDSTADLTMLQFSNFSKYIQNNLFLYYSRMRPYASSDVLSQVISPLSLRSSIVLKQKWSRDWSDEKTILE